MPRRQLLVADLFADAARAVPSRTAAVLGERSLTFAALQEEAVVVATALTRAGVGRGDRVAVWSSTALELVPLFAACARVGAVFVPLHPGATPAETAAALAVARATLLVADEAHVADARVLATSAPAPCAVVALGALGRGHPVGPDGGVPATEVAVEDTGAASLDEDDPHVVFFTSGSSGTPKGVVLSNRVNVLRSHPGALLEPRGTAVCVFPLFHMAAWTIALQQWHGRDAVVFVHAAQPDEICAAVTRHRATRLNAVPAVWRRLLDHLASATGGGAGGARDASEAARAEGPSSTSPLASLRFADTGTSATPPELLDALCAALPDAQVRVFYGSTEAGNVATLEHRDLARKPGRVGVPSVLTEWRIDDAGELWVRSPLLADGYLDDEVATAEAFVDGWYRTGDTGELDEDGYLSITGRARDVVRTGGETVAPAEVEEVLSSMDGVAEVAVVGVPDPTWGEVVCAVVVPRGSTAPPTVAEVREHCAGRLAAHKVPRRVEVVDVIPRTAATGQVQRRLLVERLQVGAGT